MLLGARVHQALIDRRDAFHHARLRAARSLDTYHRALDEIAPLTAADIIDRLGGIEWPGARPTAEIERRGLVIPFDYRWRTAQEARAWALQRLRGVTTVAVDGSQIAPSREFGVPVSLVQVAWFENPHDPDRAYTKDVRTEVLTPDDPPDEVAEYAFAESRLNQRRFTLEIDVAVDRLRALSPDPPPVVFHDGTLVLSFAGRMPDAARRVYLSALLAAVDASATCRVPLVGYVDHSVARDLVTMLHHAADLPPAGITDALLLRDRLGLFARTAAFTCARPDIIPQYRTPETDYTDTLCFLYLKTGQDRPPARIDFPRWILHAGILDHVIDIVRAEIVAGSGYPYALETADAAAVLTTEDRLAFYRLWHDFARAEQLDTPLPSKSVSKQHRR